MISENWLMIFTDRMMQIPNIFFLLPMINYRTVMYYKRDCSVFVHNLG